MRNVKQKELDYWATEVKNRVTDCVWMFLIATKTDLVSEEDYIPHQEEIKDFMKVSPPRKYTFAFLKMGEVIGRNSRLKGCGR